MLWIISLVIIFLIVDNTALWNLSSHSVCVVNWQLWVNVFSYSLFHHFFSLFVVILYLLHLSFVCTSCLVVLYVGIDAEYIYIYIYEVYKDHHVMTCIGNRIILHLFLTILTMLRKSRFYQYKIIVLSLSCHSPERWPHGGSCVAVLRSITPEIYSLLVHLYSGLAQSTICAIPPVMFN